MSNELALSMALPALPVGATARHGFRNGETLGGQLGKHVVIEFPNNYKLSIIDAYGSYGVEAGLIDPSGDMPQDNPVFDGDAVEGHLTPARLGEIIAKVAAL